MTTSTRPLPTVIGPTENALRALLVRLIASSPVTTYEEWAAINLVADPALVDQVGDIGQALGRSSAAAASLLHQLGDRDLIGMRDARWHLSADGDRVLGELRQQVAAVSAKLVAGIDEADLDTTRRVLDVIRANAVAELAT